MKRRRIVLFALAIVSTYYTACGDDDSATRPIDDGGVDAAPDRRDSGSDPEDANTTTKDAGSDTLDAGFDGFCSQVSPAPRFCSDFDNVPTVNTGWVGGCYPPGKMALDKSLFTSGPAAAHFHYEPDASPAACPYCNLERPLTDAGTTTPRVSFDVRLGDVDGGGVDGGVDAPIWFQAIYQWNPSHTQNRCGMQIG